MIWLDWTDAPASIAWLIRTTWQSLAIAAIVLLLQALLGRRLSPGWRHAMWLLVLVRLALPASVTLHILPAPAIHAEQATPAPSADANGIRVHTERYPLTTEIADDAPVPVTAEPRADRAINGWELLTAVWLGGAAGLIALILLQHVRFAATLRKRATADAAEEHAALQLLRELTPRSHRVRVTDRVRTPSVFGILWPTVLIPRGSVTSIGVDGLQMVLLHEITHVRRYDPQIEFAARLVCAVHWFNPIAWLAASRLRAERESVCDQAVLRQTPPADRPGYGHLLLSLAQFKSSPIAVPALGMASSSAHLRRRIVEISTYGQSNRSLFNRLIAGALTLGVAGIAVTDARSADPGPTSRPAAPSARVKASDSLTVDVPADVRDEAARRRLLERVGEFKLQGTLLESAVKRFEEESRLSVFVDWKGLAEAGIERDATIDIRVKDVTYAKLLSAMLDTLQTARTPLAWRIDEGVIVISNADQIAMADLSTRTYDIRDLLVQIPDFSTPVDADEDPQVKQLAARISDLDTELATARGTLGEHHAEVKKLQITRDATAAVLQQRVAALTGPATQPAESNKVREQVVEQIVSLVKDVVAHDSWKSAGGKVRTIRELGGQLIVTQTSEAHRQLAQLLTKLREQRGLQILVEARFVLIDPASLPKGTWRSRIEEAAANTKQNADAISWSLAPDEASKLIEQIKATPSATILSAPRLTIFNGQRAAVVVSTAHTYIANWQRTARGGKDTWEPVLATAEPGVRLEIQGTCTADRKGVTLTVQPKVSTLLRLEADVFKPADGTAGANREPMAIQRPVMRRQSIQTTLTVPDRQTVALCGLAVPQEIDSKGPTTLRSTDRGPRVLLLLLNPTVISEREVEPLPDDNAPKNKGPRAEG